MDNQNEPPLALQLDPDSVPSTIEAAARALAAAMPPRLAEAKSALGFFGAMGLRNDWSLWQRDTPLWRDAVNTYKIAHGDDISSLIMSWAQAIAKGERFDPQEKCKVFHDHWAVQGMTSLQAGGVEAGR